MDEVVPAPVDERALVEVYPSQSRCAAEASKVRSARRVEAGIMVHRNTSIYIIIHQVELVLGSYMDVQKPFILLTVSQSAPIYMVRNPNLSPAPRTLS
jgi:hypothetical protein